MNPDQEMNTDARLPSAPSGEELPAALATDCVRLQERVHQLEEACAHERQARLAAQAERDNYYRSLVALLRERCAATDQTTDEELDQLAHEAFALETFDELVTVGIMPVQSFVTRTVEVPPGTPARPRPDRPLLAGSERAVPARPGQGDRDETGQPRDGGPNAPPGLAGGTS